MGQKQKKVQVNRCYPPPPYNFGRLVPVNSVVADSVHSQRKETCYIVQLEGSASCVPWNAAIRLQQREKKKKKKVYSPLSG